MRIGIKNQGPMTARWAGADNFELKYLGTEEEVLTQDGDTFIEEQLRERDNQLTAMFTDLSDNHKDASVLIVNADCNRSDTYGWSTANLGTNKGQAWDGDDNNVYWDVWNANSLESSMTQTIGYLPAGNYTLNGLLRCSSGKMVTLRAIHQGLDGEDNTFEETITGIGDASETGSPWQYGWQQVTLPTFKAQSGDRLVISAIISTTSTAWWSADHFTLSWTEPEETVVGIHDITREEGADASAQNRSKTMYNLHGQRMDKSPFKSGLLIIDNKKRVVR